MGVCSARGAPLSTPHFVGLTIAFRCDLRLVSVVGWCNIHTTCRAAYPAHAAIKLILDNHSAHISKETTAWIARQPAHRFEFTFTPTHGSWLNLIEGFFSKLARSVLRHIRVASKQELKDRIMAAMDFFNQEPVVHTWTHKLDKAV